MRLARGLSRGGEGPAPAGKPALFSLAGGSGDADQQGATGAKTVLVAEPLAYVAVTR